MNIVLEATSAYTGLRAIKRYTKSLIHAFFEKGYEDNFIIFTNFFRGKCNEIDSIIKKKDNFIRKHMPIPLRFKNLYWEYIGLININPSFTKVDIFHALGDNHPTLKLHNYIITLHGIAYFSRPDLLDPDYVKEKQKNLIKACKIANYFIAVSEHTKREFLKVFSSIKSNSIRVIPLGVGEEFHPIEKNRVKKILKEKFKIESPYILFVGGLEPHKNIHGILEAFYIIKDEFKNMALILVGKTSRKNNYLENLLNKYKIQNRIKIIPFLPQEGRDLPVLYNGAKCFVFPSFTEGWASPPLEAMACGTPVVTSNVSSLPETVNDAAIKVDPYNPEEIAKAVRKILNDPDFSKNLTKKGLTHSSKYTWKRCAEETYSFYKDIIENRIT
ncbi:MAG: glycosyltransferase family 4 protein [Candidatus Marinimicrobia bacterium]|nr:glycosyltransferase family 4 protein [Candidatus Neomarinimicrobiota bacterium]